MPLRRHGNCRLPVALRQLLVKRPGNSSQTQTRCIANSQRFQDSLDAKTSFRDGIAARSSFVVAAKEPEGRTRTFTSTAPQSSLEPPSETATTDHTQRDSRHDASSKLDDVSNINEGNASSPEDFMSQLKKRRLKFANQEKGKENRLLVNQLLKDKSHLSYDWRIPVELLERHYEPPNTYTTNTDVSLCRKVVLGVDTNSEHRGPRRIQRIETRNPKGARIAREISRPSVWSKEILADYVKDLVEYEYHKDAIPRVSQLQDKGYSNIAEITSALDDIFHSPTTNRYLSIQAYKTALHFYYDNGLSSKARALYIQIEDSRIKIPTEIYNLVLRGSASSRDLHNFTFILQKSIQRGFKPDIETWNSLLTTINSTEVRAVIIQRMWERGILDSLPENGNALRLIIQQEVGSHIDKRGDRGAFLDHLDDRYGKTWLTTSTGNKLLYEFGKRRSTSETLSLLPGMKMRGWQPDEISLDTLLRQSLLLRQHKYAIEILESFRHYFRVEPGKLAHETLFLLAWRGHLLNSARVVWASACIGGHVTFKMRDFVFQSLLSNKAVQPSDGGPERFKKLAGKFVVGIEKPKNVMPPETGGNSKAHGPIARRSSVQSAQKVLQSDLLAAGSPRIEQDLGKLLLQALGLDMEWVSTKFLSAADLQQVLQSGIKIRRAVSYGQRGRLRIRQQITYETQRKRLIRKVSNSAETQGRTRSLARSVYARTIDKFKVDILRRVKVVQIRKRVSAHDIKASSTGARRLLRRSRASAVGRSVPYLRLHFVPKAHKVDQTLPVIRKYSVNKTFRRTLARRIQRKPLVRLNTHQCSVGSLRRKLLKRNDSTSADVLLPVQPKQVIRPVAPEYSAVSTRRRNYGTPHSRPTARKRLFEFPPSSVTRECLIRHTGREPTANAVLLRIPVDRQKRRSLNHSVPKPFAGPSMREVPSDPAPAEPSIGPSPQTHNRLGTTRRPIVRKRLVEPTARNYSGRSLLKKSLLDPSIREPPRKSRKPSKSANRAVQSPSDLTPVPQKPSRHVIVKSAASGAEQRPAAHSMIQSPAISDPARNSVAGFVEENPSVPPGIRKLPFGDASPKVSTDSVVEKHPAMLKLSSDLLEKNPTPHPRIRKHLAGREKPMPRPPLIKHSIVRKESTRPTPIRRHETLVYQKHPVDPAILTTSVSPDEKRLPATLETAHLHSSLDKVLELSKGLDKGANSESVEEESMSSRSHQQAQKTSSTQEASASMRVRRCPPRERPFTHS